MVVGNNRVVEMAIAALCTKTPREVELLRDDRASRRREKMSNGMEGRCVWSANIYARFATRRMWQVINTVKSILGP